MLRSLPAPALLARKASALPKETWLTLACVLPTIAAVRVALWVLPYRTVSRLFAPTDRPGRLTSVAEASARLRVTAWVGRTLLGDKPCLTQAIAARWLLARIGYATKLVIGASRTEGKLVAHAWLEHEGRVVLGGSDSLQLYAPLSSMRTLSPDGSLQGNPSIDL